MMRGVREGWRRLRSLGRRNELESGLEDEIRFHIDRQTEKNRQAGMAPEEARRQALIKFGGVERARESTRDEYRFAFVEDFLRDLRYGGRALRRSPGFTVVATLTLAVGIGATTAMFSVVNGILLRPLPYPEQDRLIEVVHQAPGVGIGRLYASSAVYFTYADHNRTFDGVAYWDWDQSPVTVTGSGDPEAVQSLEMTHEALALLGADPILGRRFTPEDDRPGSAPTVMISHGYWQRKLGGADPVGKMLVVDGVPRQIIGVLPPSFQFFRYPADLFYPRQPVRAEARFPSFDGRAFARLKKGVTLAEASADVARMIPILRAQYGPGAWENSRFGPQLQYLKDSVVGNLGETLWLMMGTIALLLLIACANVANLVLVRTQAERPQLAIRAALGAGWAAIARVVLTESALLGLAGGAAGLAIAYFSLPLLLSLGAEQLPQIMAIKIDVTVLLVTLGLCLFATVGFAILPVIQLASPAARLTGSMHVGRSLTEGRESHRARHVLVVSQVALVLVLLIGSGLMIRTFQRLRQVDPGFRDAEHVQTFRLTVPRLDRAGTAQPGGRADQQELRGKQEILERVAALPGVESVGFAGFSDGLPMDGDGRQVFMLVDGRPPAPDDTTSATEIQFVSPGFVETLRTPVIAGRTFDWNDVYGDRPVVLVSENLARAQFGSPALALGRRVAFHPQGPRWDVVGVVKDVHHEGVGKEAPQTVIRPVVASEAVAFVVRSPRAGTAGFLGEVRKAVWSVNPNLSLEAEQTLGEMYRHSMARTSMTLKLLAITGGVALLLGLIGIYGVVSYAISQRRREIGIRLALGAAPGEVRRMFVRLALVLVGIGVAIGLGAAAGLTRLMESQLFGVRPLDPLTHVAVAVALFTAAGLASYLSAHGASALDPVEVLKGD
jgi:putative ABC transport system permease protein